MKLSWPLLLSVFAGSLVVTTVVAGLVLVRLPDDYFIRPFRSWRDRAWTPGAVAVLVLKNLAGWAIVVAGIIMSLPGVPGQGLLTVFMGLLLADFPGKYRLERRIVRFRRVTRAINRLRIRFGRRRLKVPEDREGLA